jgi:hypothetical protein
MPSLSSAVAVHSIHTHTDDLEENHHVFILRLIRHTSTLSKSKADAEEERKEREAEARRRRTNPAPRTRNDPSSEPFTDPLTDEGAMNDGQDDGSLLVTTTIKRFLKYDNPFIYASRDHRYVVEAICTGQLCGVLPSVIHSDRLLSSSNLTPGQLQLNLHANYQTGTMDIEFEAPVSVSVDQQLQMRDTIQCQMETKRRANAGITANGFDDQPERFLYDETGMDCDDPSRDGDANASEQHRYRGSWLRKAIDIIESVRQKYGLDETQSQCFHFMTDRLLHDFHRLPETQESHALTDCRFLYMGGEGGTGISHIVKAIVDCFDQLQCRSRLNISATTGVAANIIGGSTIDSLCKLEWIDPSAVRVDRLEPAVGLPSQVEISRPVTRWTRCQFLILDEVHFRISVVARC